MPIKHITRFLFCLFVASGLASCSSDDDEASPNPIIGYWVQGGYEIDLKIVAPEEHQKSAINYLTKEHAGEINESYLWFFEDGTCNDKNAEMTYIIKGSTLYINPLFYSPADAKSSVPATEEYKFAIENDNNKLKLEKAIPPATVWEYLEKEGKNMDGIEINSAIVTKIFSRRLIYTTEK